MSRYTYIPNRVIDTNGIADGASIYFYEEGTTTPVSIFSDSQLSVEVSNPYVVAAGAAVPALYYEGVPPRVKVVGSDGAVISDDDPYNPLGAYVIDIRDYGAVDGGQINDALQAALDAVEVRGWGVVRVEGNYTLSSSALSASSGISVPPNCELDMRGANITVTGTTICFKFVVSNVSNVKIHGARIYDNSQATGQGGIISVFCTDAATSDMRNITISDLDLHNCKAVGWIDVGSEHPDYDLYRVSIRNIRASSYAGNSISTSSVSYGAHPIYLLASGGGDIYDVDIENITVNGQYIKGSVFILAAYGTVPASVIERVSIRNVRDYQCGQDGGINDSGCNGILIYGNTRFVTLDGYLSIAPRDCAVYTAGGMDNVLRNIECHGQNSTADATLPKGVIALNSPIRYIVDGVIGRNNYHDIDFTCSNFNWTGLNSYRQVDTMVQNDTGKFYRLITPGTSAAAGGPTGTGTGITDGTCVWDYAGTELPSNTIITNLDLSRAVDDAIRLSTACIIAGVTISGFKIYNASGNAITVRNDTPVVGP